MTGLGTVSRRPRQRRAALLLCGTALAGALLAPAALAADAVWNGLAGNSNYSSGANWVGGVPAEGTGSIATFGPLGGANTTVTLDQVGNFDIGTLRVWGAQSYVFDKTGGTNIFDIGSGLDIENGSSATFNISLGSMQIRGGSAQTAAINVLPGAALYFQNNSSAGDASINSSSAVGFFGMADAGTATILTTGQLGFWGLTTAGFASITATGGTVTFGANSSALFAGIAASNAAIVSFQGDSRGANARISLFDTASLDLSSHNAGTITLVTLDSPDATTTVNLGANTLAVGGPALDMSFAGVISGTGGSLAKTGGGRLILSGANTYNGTTAVSGGVLNVQNGAAFGTSTVVVSNGAGLEMQSGSLITVTNALTLNGTGSLNGGALRNVAGDNRYNGAITLGSNTRINSDADQLFLSTITGVGTNLTVGGAGNTSVGNVTLGTGGITKDGTGGFALAGVSTYTGATTVNNGVLQLNNGSAIPDASAVILSAPGRLNLQNSETIGSLAGSGNISLNAATLTTGGNNTITTYSGIISGGTGALVKAGTGTLTLTGANSYAGGTTVAGGILELSGPVATLGAASARTTVSGATLDLGGTNQTQNGGVLLDAGSIQGGGLSSTGVFELRAGSVSANLSGTGQIEKNGAGTLTLSGSNSYSGGTRIAGGTLVAQGGNAVGDNSSVLVLTGSTFRVLNDERVATLSGSIGDATASVELNGADLTLGSATSAAALYWGSITGSGGIVKDGNFRQVLAGNNSYDGATQILGGTLFAVGAGKDSISDGSAVTVAAGAKLSLVDPSLAPIFTGLESDDETIGSLAGAGTVDLGAQTLTVGGNNASTTFSGVITGSGGLTKTGSGTLILSGSSVGSPFTGTATVNQGILRVDGVFGDTVNDTAQVNVAGGGTLQGNGMIHGDVAVQANGTLSAGASPGTLTIAGDLTLDAGSTSKFEFGTPNVVGGATNDLVQVGGNLTLAGNLEAEVASAGYYRLFEYGTLTPGSAFDSETVTSTNAGFTLAGHSIGFDIPGEVYMIALGAGQNIQFWDGSSATLNVVEGGTGTWDTASFNWTDVNGAVNTPWMQSVGVFAGLGGTVTVAGTQNFDTLQFTTGGYRLTGGSLAFKPASGTTGTIAVDGGVTAFVDSVLVNGTTATDFAKTGSGTLILTAANTYTGTTSILGGILQLGDGGNTGSIGAGNVINNGVLAFDRSDSVTFANDISGTGGLTQTGTGTVTLTGNNSFSGDTVVESGTLVAATGSALSADSHAFVDQGARLEIVDGVHADVKGLSDGPSGQGGVVNIGTADNDTVLFLGFNGPASSDFSGQITGAGSLEIDQGDLTLRGASDIGGDLYVSPDATLTLFGPNASFNAAGGTNMVSALPGVEAGGSLNMLAGAKLTTDNLLVGGVMLLDGADTKATASGLTFVGSMANAAALTIQNGAVMDSLGGALIENPFEAANAVVTGAGSTWNVSTFLGIGNMFGGGTGNLTVTKGGVVNLTGDATATTVIAADPTSTGLGPSMVMVTGAGSKLTTVNLLVGLPPCACGDSLPGQLFIANGGSVIASQPVVIEQGSLLSLGSGGLSGSLVAPSITNNGRIQANFTDSVTLDLPISGTGRLSKYNTGTLVLNGANTYTGTTIVYGGKLVVGDSTHPGASLASTVTLKSGTSLGGIGTLGGLVTESGATVGPGNSIGTLNVTGDVSLAAGSTYEVEIAGNGTSDRIAATGKATLSGGQVAVTALDAQTSYQAGQTYTILTAAGGVTGSFDPAVLSRSAFLDASLLQSANAVDLKIAIKGSEEPGGEKPVFLTVADTYNRKQTAGALDTLQQSGQSLALYNKLLPLSADEARAAFDGLSGEMNASTVTGLLEDSRFVREAMNDRLRSAFETVGAVPLMGYGDDAKALTTAAVPSERYGAWGSVFGSWGHFDSDGNAAKLSRSVGGFVTGIDGSIVDDVRLGFLAGYSHFSLKVDDRRSSASTDNYHLGIYGGTEWGALAFRSGLAYTWSQIESGRQVSFPGFTDSLTGDYRAGTTQVFGELGYGIKAGSVALEPFANLAYVNVHTNGFTEQGGASALTVESGSNDVTFTTLGMRASTDFDLGTIKATARGMIGWRHGFGDITPTVSQAFTGSNAFQIAGAPIAKDAATLEAGLDFAIAPRATLGVSYQGQLGSGASDHGVRADFSVKF